MTKFSLIAVLGFAGVAFTSCDGIHRKPYRSYMPDMFYSRAYETYAERDSNFFTMDPAQAGAKIFYNNKPVAGTIALGEDMPFPYAMDKVGDTANYVASRAFPNPEPALTPGSQLYTETEREFLIYCGVCHGAKLDGNGPLYKDGDGPFPAKPADLAAGAKYVAMPDGQMFYSITYGFNMMGSYASQLTRKQRWDIIHYIKLKQKEAAGGAAASDSSATATSTATAMK